VRLIAFSQLVATPWKNGGGVTRQIAIDPPGSRLDDFGWRLSTAEVAQDGPFSRFDGVDRQLHILAGEGLDLRFADGTQRLRRGEHADFAGEAEVTGALVAGPVTDFNIMVRRGRVRMRAEALRIDGHREIRHAWGMAALFVLGGELAVAGDVARRFDTVLLDGPRPLAVSGMAEVLLVGFEELG